MKRILIRMRIIPYSVRRGQILKQFGAARFFAAAAAIFLALLLSMPAIPGAYASADGAGLKANKKNGYIVKLKKEKYRAFSTKAAFGLNHIPYTDGLFTADSLEDIQSLADAGMVEYVEKNNDICLLDSDTQLTSDPMISNEWYAAALEIAGAWDKGLDGRGVTVAVIDSGVNEAHEDLAGTLISGYNFTGSDTAAYNIDSTGHGTFVSGIIAAVKNNGKGLAGLADRVNLLELRCFDSKTTSTSNIVSAIAYAIQQKADVINMSFGGTKQSLAESLREQIDKAAEQGIIMVSAVGNGEYGDTVSLNYPAAFDSVVGVGMVDKTGVVAPNSQKNSSVYVTAPGVEIPGLGNTSTDAYVSSGTGTSYAAPIVTSLAAMAKQTNKEINGEGFKKLLRDCAVDDASLNGYDTSYGYGVVNARLMAEALTKDYNIVYNCNGGVLTGTAGIDYPVSFKIGRSDEIYLPIPVRSGYKFAGWYDNASMTGSSISKVAGSSTGDVEYYAKWYDAADTALSSVVVQGVTAAVDEQNSHAYHVVLPSNHAPVLSTDIDIVPLDSGAWTGTPIAADDGRAWIFEVSKGEGNTTSYTVFVSDSSFARPRAIGTAPSGEAVPASYDLKTAAVPYMCRDISAWFKDVNDETSYSIISCSGKGIADIEGNKATYIPDREDAGKTVRLVIGAKNGPFTSTDNETLSIDVKAVPVSNPAIEPSTVLFDKNLSSGDAAVKIDLYGNSLVSVVNDVYSLKEDVDYSISPEQLPGENQTAVLKIKEAYLKGLPQGNYKLTLLFGNGGSDVDVKAYLYINVSAATYTVTFMNDGAVYTQISNVNPDTKIALPADPKKSGCTFRGWFTQAEGKGIAITSSIKVDGNLTVYAKWDCQTSGGGSGGSGISFEDNKSDAAALSTPIAKTPYPLSDGEVPLESGVDADNEKPSVLSDTYNEPEAGDWDNLFSDVGIKDWYFDAVAFVCEKGFFSGLSQNTFAPNATMTRGMLVTVLYRMAGEPPVNTTGDFFDVAKGSWYEKAVSWALANKIVSGLGGNRFLPDAPVTREQMAVIIYNYNRRLQKDYTPTASKSTLDRFQDKDKVSKWAVEGIIWAVEAKLVNGKTENRLDAANTATRAEVAEILRRFLNEQ